MKASTLLKAQQAIQQLISESFESCELQEAMDAIVDIACGCDIPSSVAIALANHIRRLADREQADSSREDDIERVREAADEAEAFAEKLGDLWL